MVVLEAIRHVVKSGSRLVQRWALMKERAITSSHISWLEDEYMDLLEQQARHEALNSKPSEDLALAKTDAMRARGELIKRLNEINMELMK